MRKEQNAISGARKRSCRRNSQPLLSGVLKLALSIILTTFLARLAQAISIKPADFDRLVMYCYLGGPAPTSFGGYQQSISASQAGAFGGGAGFQQANQLDPNNGRARFNSPPMTGTNQQGPNYAELPGNSRSTGSSFNQLGQSVPRANTIDNFIALVSKIEAASPRLATNPDQLIRTLLGRFRMDNFYYDVRTRTSIDERDHRVRDVIPALLNYTFQQQSAAQMAPSQYLSPMDEFQENLLEPDEKCSMYFMLSHFVVKELPAGGGLASVGVPQLVGPLGGQRPPSLQAAGAGYPAQSAQAAFGPGNSGGAQPNAGRYPGPSPSFGSPATSNMNSFGAGLTNQPEYTGNNPLGANTLQPNYNFNQNANNIRNAGQYAGTSLSNSKSYQVPYVDMSASQRLQQQQQQRDEKLATEFGVVGVPNQENAAIVLNRVLMGILASNVMSQPIRQLASVIYSNKFISATAKLDDDIDPLYAVTLADLWALSALPKAGKLFDFKLLGNNGRWNDSMCPTSFHLDRSSNIRFTTAELLGGLDGFNLGMVRKELLARGRNLRLSDLLRMYYSKAGFRPHFAEFGVCSRATAINSHLDDLRRQADSYLRLYQLDSPTNDNDVANNIMRLDSFKDYVRTASQLYTPQEICQDSSSSSAMAGYNDIYPSGDANGEQCELGKADLVTILDSSPQANSQFMNLVITKLAHKIGLSRFGNSLTILTNQQDSTGYGGSYSFNAILRNSTNTAEVGCALAFDDTRSYQGGQITEPTRLVEMFERTLVNLDTEYLLRQNMGQASGQASSWSSSYPNGRYLSQLLSFGSGSPDYSAAAAGLRPRNTGGAKVIVWFNFGQQAHLNPLASGPTNWNSDSPVASIYPTGSGNRQDFEYRFYEARRFFKENFRGAAVLAVANNRDQVKAFVEDELRDIFTDLPQSSSSSAVGADYYPSSSQQADPASLSQLNGPAEILANKLLQRMCEVPAIFQYPMCFRAPSENAPSVGYISPRRKQYWMMSPKTFFSSATVRMAFRVEGGRLRVCFGRMPKPDESAMRNPQLQQYGYQQQQAAVPINQQQASGISLIQPGNNYNELVTPAGQAQSYPSAGSYYTGRDYGVCRDVAPGQEIDFVVEDPCYKKSIAECEPFYFVIKEITNPGEGDPNYMCRDVGCKRFDQVRFTMTHTGVACSSAPKTNKASWTILLISLIATLFVNSNRLEHSLKALSNHWKRIQTRPLLARLSAASLLSLSFLATQAQAQLSSPADFGQNRFGERRGNYTPSEVLAIILLVMTIVAGLALTIGLCYYVYKRNNSRGMQKVPQNDFS